MRQLALFEAEPTIGTELDEDGTVIIDTRAALRSFFQVDRPEHEGWHWKRDIMRGLAARGATDDEILTACGECFGIWGGCFAGGWDGPGVCYSYQGGADPIFVNGSSHPRTGRGLRGRRLADAVRELFDIPHAPPPAPTRGAVRGCRRVDRGTPDIGGRNARL